MMTGTRFQLGDINQIQVYYRSLGLTLCDFGVPEAGDMAHRIGVTQEYRFVSGSEVLIQVFERTSISQLPLLIASDLSPIEIESVFIRERGVIDRCLTRFLD